MSLLDDMFGSCAAASANGLAGETVTYWRVDNDGDTEFELDLVAHIEPVDEGNVRVGDDGRGSVAVTRFRFLEGGGNDLTQIRQPKLDDLILREDESEWAVEGWSPYDGGQVVVTARGYDRTRVGGRSIER